MERWPEKPTILVEGVNNTLERQKLVWLFVSEESESIRSVTFERQKVAADSPEIIAGNTDEGDFTVFPLYSLNYSASLPSTLTLRIPVTNDDEFIYTIRVSFLKNNVLMPPVLDSVQVIVFGK